MLDHELMMKLRAPFPVEDHRERDLPGKKKWFFIPWQLIRKRLNETCPGWQCSFSDPVIAGETIVIRCTITIEGVSREAPGSNDALKERTSAGNYKYGSPVECAVSRSECCRTADAFKNAAEMFGVGAYLDDQAFVIKYLRDRGDGRGYKFAHDNQWIGKYVKDEKK